jgi:F-type H+-transporting ATPase subunit delta
MNEGKISVRYSKALFLIAREKGLVEKVREDMLYILELTSLEDVKDLLISPVIENSVKKSALNALLKGKIEDLSMDMVNLTVNNNREMFLQGIARAYINVADKFNGITKATLTTAKDISDKVKRDIVSLIEKGLNTSVDLAEIIDPGITGGFMLKVEDTFIDGSVKSQLRKIRKQLKEEL